MKIPSTHLQEDTAPRGGIDYFAATFGCYLGVRLCFTYLFFQYDPLAGTIIGLSINMSVLAVALFYAYGSPAIPKHLLPRVLSNWTVRWVLLFLAFSCCSLLWTFADSKLAAGMYWGGMAADVGTVLCLLRVLPVQLLWTSMMKGYICGVALLSLVAWTAPVMPDLRMGDEDFLSPNAYGFECALAVPVAHYLSNEGALWKILGAGLLITLLRSLSKTSIFAFMIAEAFYIFRDARLTRNAKYLIGLGAMLLLLCFWPILSNYYDVYTNAGNQAETLTGRTAIWGFAFLEALEHPWIGHGFHSARSVLPPVDNYQPWHTHNELLEQFFNYGVVGLVLIAGLYGSLYRQLRRSMPGALRTLCLTLLILVLVRGFADTERFDLSLPTWMLCLLSVALAQRVEFAEVGA